MVEMLAKYKQFNLFCKNRKEKKKIERHCNIHNTSFSSKLINGFNKLECLSLQAVIASPFVSLEENEVL